MVNFRSLLVVFLSVLALSFPSSSIVRGESVETVQYEVTFTADWSQETHPTDFPRSPHFSGLIGGTHNDNIRFWQIGETATDGIKRMAELGAKNTLQSEVNDQIDQGDAFSVISGGGVGTSPGEVSTEFTISKSHALVTLVSMIAPSPDWFVGVSGLDLRANGQWLEEVDIALVPYDAGTDSGESFSSPNQITSPRQPIQHITGFPFMDADPLGTFSFRLQTDLGPALQAGDSDRNLEFNQFDLIQVQIANKYLSGQPATWGEGDWDGAPGGNRTNPPLGNGQFDQEDIVAALDGNNYLSGAYAANHWGSNPAAEPIVTLGYNTASGRVWLELDSDDGRELTSINIQSTRGVFTGAPAENIDGSFDNHSDNNLFKATFGGSFGSVNFGNVARRGISEADLLADLSVTGSFEGGGSFESVQLNYVAVPEPSTMLLLMLGTPALWLFLFLTGWIRGKDRHH